MKEEKLRQSLDEKRKSYRCGNNYVTLDQVATWRNTAPDETPSEPAEFPVDPIINSKISIFTGDITALEIDAIVNAANNQLAGGGGVDGAIHNAAGAELLQSECRTLNGCPTGDAKITGGYNLPSKYIIHTVGPVGEKPDLLKSCYKKCLQLAQANNIQSIAFPCISTGVYRYPKEAAARVALSTVRTYLQEEENAVKSFTRIIFCLFGDTDVSIYNKLLPIYFPVK